MKERPNYQAIAEGVKLTRKEPTLRQTLAVMALEYYKGVVKNETRKRP